MTIDLKPEIAEALRSLASSKGLSIEEYLERHVATAFPAESCATEGPDSEDSGMVWESGFYIYRPAQPSPPIDTDELIRQMREERDRHVLGTNF